MSVNDRIFALALTIARTEALLSKAEHERDQATGEGGGTDEGRN